MQALGLTRRSGSPGFNVHQPGPVESNISVQRGLSFLGHVGTASEPKPLESNRDAAQRFLSGPLLSFENKDRIPPRLRKQVSYPTFSAGWMIAWEQIENIAGDYCENINVENRGALQHRKATKAFSTAASPPMTAPHMRDGCVSVATRRRSGVITLTALRTRTPGSPTCRASS
jgi:hypothetical protein